MSAVHVLEFEDQTRRKFRIETTEGMPAKVTVTSVNGSVNCVALSDEDQSALFFWLARHASKPKDEVKS